MTILEIRKFISEGRYRFTSHAIQKMAEREINRREIEEALAVGEIIEEYAQDKYSPSCLIWGKTSHGRHIHVVCSQPPSICIITAYVPDNKLWINYKTRREVR